MSDDELVLLYRAGEQEALYALYERYAKRVYAFARRMGCDHHDAEDALHDTFWNVARYCHTYVVDTSFKKWLFSIARNEVRRVRKASARRRAISLEESTGGEATPPLVDRYQGIIGAKLESEEVLEWTRRVIGDEAESLLRARYVDGRTVSDLAIKLGKKPNTISQRLVRILRRIRQEY